MAQCFKLSPSMIEMSAEASSGSRWAQQTAGASTFTRSYIRDSFPEVSKMTNKRKLYKYLFATSKGIQGRIKCFVLKISFQLI